MEKFLDSGFSNQNRTRNILRIFLDTGLEIQPNYGISASGLFFWYRESIFPRFRTWEKSGN